MSIKGSGKELYPCKSGISILNLIGAKTTINYEDIEKIDYCLGTHKNNGFIHFLTIDNRKITFEFPEKSNTDISKLICFFQRKFSIVNIIEYKPDDVKKERSLRLVPTFGYKELSLSPLGFTLNQMVNGYIYLDNKNAQFYSLVSYEWNGPEYETITKKSGKSNSKKTEKTKGKAIKIGTGALLGSVVGPAGTIVGAAMGAGSKGGKKSFETSQADITTRESNIEKDTMAIICLRSIDNNKNYKITFVCNSTIDSKIRCFDFN